MNERTELGRYSIGLGDRFEQQAEAQLRACVMALERGVEVIPVWNKSNREHLILGSKPAGTRAAADRVVHALRWSRAYFVDADHIRLETVDRFIPDCDFYTIDVADCIGRPADSASVNSFVRAHPELTRATRVPSIDEPLASSERTLEGIASKYLCAVQQAARIYGHIASRKEGRPFITEVSLDETDIPQSPLELLVLLAALSDEGVPVQTVAPRFCGCFHKGVDYIGDVREFETQFYHYLAVIAFAVKGYGLPQTLKLSLHSGSDKFSLYGPIRRALTHFNAGLHLKTAGTTWLEEFIGIVESGGKGLELGKWIALAALERIDELCAPYQNVVSIDRTRLPAAQLIRNWGTEQLAAAVRHNPGNPAYNGNLRQLLHVAYKIAAEQQQEFIEALTSCRSTVARNVTQNLFERHVRPLFMP